MSFYDLYFDLAEELNDTATDNLTRTKKWINYTLKDLCNMYEFPALYDTATITGTSYDFDRLSPLTTAATVDLFSSSASDTQVATVYGSIINSGTRTYQSEDVTLTGATTASTTNNFNFIERIELASAAVGQISVASNSALKGVVEIGETKIANDFKRIIKVDASGDVQPMSLADRKLIWTNDSSINRKTYNMSGSTVTFYGTSTSRETTYLKKHPLLINDYDESPIIAYGGVEESDIVEAARLGWGLRFEDEQDGTMGKQMYKQKLAEIIAELTYGGDDKKKVSLTRRI